jgi:hypothetical protein
MVDPLQNIPDIRPSLVEPYLVRIIDVAMATGRVTHIIARHEKAAGKGTDVVTPSGRHENCRNYGCSGRTRPVWECEKLEKAAATTVCNHNHLPGCTASHQENS